MKTKIKNKDEKFMYAVEKIAELLNQMNEKVVNLENYVKLNVSQRATNYIQ